MKRTFSALVTLSAVSAMLFVVVPNASAAVTPSSAADTAAGDILGAYQSSTGLFSTTCPASAEC